MNAPRAYHPTPSSPRRILVPTDFSPCADHALEVAVALARRHHARLQILHVVTHLEGDVYSPLRFSPEASATGQSVDAMLHELLERTVEGRDVEGLSIETVKLRSLAIAPRIAEQARTFEADLIVIGTHGRRGWRHLFLGSTAEEVLRSAPCDVLTVRSAAEVGSGPFRRILVPVDFSAPSQAAARVGCDLASRDGARLDLLHVIEPLPFAGVLSGTLTVNDLIPNIELKTEAELEAFFRKTGRQGIEVDYHLEEGRPPAAITRFAEQRGTDLCVMASHGLTGLAHALMGSVTERVLRAAPCPVWVVRTKPEEGQPERSTQGHQAVVVDPGGPPG